MKNMHTLASSNAVYTNDTKDRHMILVSNNNLHQVIVKLVIIYR